ncbi:MAG TPA: hypothetical protein VHQ65_02030 [Thermoanaerobaculia bacterium]|nr:hypothetical protein [Thermoanaerobaculia bacterium]
MSRKSLTLVAPVVLALGLAACDNTEEYEARIADLEGQLETVRGEADTYRGEAEELRTQLQELEATGPAAGGAAAADVEAVQGEIETALAALADADQQLQTTTVPEVTAVRTSLQDAAQAIGNIAQNMGIELEAVAPEQAGQPATAEPAGAAEEPPAAAGAEEEGQQPAAGGATQQ